MFDRLKNAIARRAAELGVTEYEIYYSSNSSSAAETLGHEISSLTSSTSGGICFRCAVDGKMGYASTQLMDEAEMAELVDRALENGRYTEKEDTVGIFPGAEKYGKTNAPEYVPLTAEDIRRAALELQEANYAVSDKVREGTQSQVETTETVVRIVNSHGLDLSNKVGLNVAVSVAVVEDKGESQDDYTFCEYGKKSAREMAEEAVNSALEKIGATVPPTGKYNIVFDAKQMRTMLSVFADAFSAKTAQAGMSRLAGKEGEKIASDIINITDDPMREGFSIQTYFDAEGVPAYKKDVVKNGVLMTLLHNRETAAVAGCETTGNASKAGYSAPIGVSTYAFCIEAGENTKDELMALAGDGIYITEVKGLHAGANSVTGDFSIESAGFMIEEGKKTYPIKSFTVAGNFFDMLRDVSALSNEVDVGFSGYGAPDLLVRDMSVAGK
ncbi:MAG: TldD/PmbA family protein [Clostridia bacterium]|nr:TldD/PmbA family protein [Clostridia bacterium]